MLYLNDHIGELDLGKALSVVSAQRHCAALRYRQERDRRLSLAAYLLLMEGLQREYGISTPPDFIFGPHGKPLLRDYPDIHFNLSHCPRAALCVIANQPVGCDIEEVPRQLDPDLCRHCMNDRETAEILAADNPALAFISRWTQKEALLKLTGEGLTDNLPALLQSPLAATVSFQSLTAADNSYVYTVCRPKA